MYKAELESFLSFLSSSAFFTDNSKCCFFFHKILLTTRPFLTQPSGWLLTQEKGR